MVQLHVNKKAKHIEMLTNILGGDSDDEEKIEALADGADKVNLKLHNLFFKSIISSSKNNARKKLRKEFEFENIGEKAMDVLDVEEVQKREYHLVKGYKDKADPFYTTAHIKAGRLILEHLKVIRAMRRIKAPSFK